MNSNTKTQRKRRLKKAIIIIAAALAVLLAITAAAPHVINLIREKPSQPQYNETDFFPADYNKNILQDKLYLSLDRDITYTRYGETVVLNQSNLQSLHPVAGFFYNYFNCIINGDYAAYPSFYTDECLNHPNFNRPQSFTMQGLYDINVDLHSITVDESIGQVSELYLVHYRIFENNGSFTKEVLPDEPYLRAFEIKITNGNIKISSIGFISSK